MLVQYLRPDGGGENEGAAIVSLEGNDNPRIIVRTASDPDYADSGHILYTRAGNNTGIWAAPFSLADLELTGDPFLVAPGAAWPSVAADGTLVFVLRESAGLGQLVWVDREGRVEKTIGQPLPRPRFPAISPDGGRISMAVRENENWDLWVQDLDRDTRTRLTFHEDGDWVSSWTGDGRVIYSTGSSELQLAVRAADGTGDRTMLVAGLGPSVSPKHDVVVFIREGEKAGGLAYLRLDSEETPEPVVFLDTPADESWPRLSPDGRYVAYSSDESGRREIYITTFPDGVGKWQVSIDGGSGPRWSRESGEIFYYYDDRMMVVDVSTQPKLVLGRPRELFIGRPNDLELRPNRYDVTPDGRRLVVVQQVGDQDRQPGITVVQNWLSEFED